MSSNDVNLTSGIRSNLLLLQRTTKQVENIQTRLATGNKVNSALDGPNQFFAAQSLNQRAGDLSRLKESLGQAISTIQAGDKGITAIQDLVEQARGITTSALSSLGNDPASIATRQSLADQFNRIKGQIDSLAGDSGFQGKNLLAGNGLSLGATADSRTAVNAITGFSNAQVSNVVSTDTFSVRVSGTGNISADLGDIAAAEDARGLTSLKVSGTLSATAGNFDDISIEIRGNTGRERTAVVTENGESRTIKFFDNTQNAVASTVTAGSSGVAQVSRVAISGAIEEGDTFTATINGQAFTVTAQAADVSDADPAVRRTAIRDRLQGVVDAAVGAGGTQRFTIAADGDDGFTVTSGQTTGTGASFAIGATAGNAATKDVSISFSSGTTVSFTIDRTALEQRGTAANGVSTIEKNVDITLSATNLNGVTVERSGANARGAAKLTDGENALQFGSGTVRVNVDSAVIKAAASAQSSANLATVQRSDANTENDLSVQFNERNTSNIQVVSRNVSTDGQGLRIDFAQNGFRDRSDIDNAIASLDFAQSTLRGASQSLSTNLNVIQTRDSFTDDFTNVLTEGANKLTQADQNQEGANLLLLQTRQQLGTISLSLANQAQQSILRLF
jgi:flagellin